MSLILRRIVKIASVFAFIGWLSQPASAQASATDLVERLNHTLIDVMQNADTLGYDGRYKTLAPVLQDSFDFPLMAKVAVGKYWKGLDDEQKKQLIQSFARLSVATFASRFDGYGGEVFEVEGESNQRKNTVLVSNKLVKSSGEVVPLNYLLRESDGGWRIVDVYLDAKYSELALKRSEYSSVVSREGFDALIGIMENKIATLASAPGG